MTVNEKSFTELPMVIFSANLEIIFIISQKIRNVKTSGDKI